MYTRSCENLRHGACRTGSTKGSRSSSRAATSRASGKKLQLTLPPTIAPEKSFASLSSKDASLVYGARNVAVQALLDQAGAPAVVSLIGDIGRGMPFGQAF